MTAPSESDFKRLYASLEKHLRLKGLRPKTIEAYARAIRRIGDYFDHDIEDLSEQQLTEYFTDLLGVAARKGLTWTQGRIAKIELCAKRTPEEPT